MEPAAGARPQLAPAPEDRGAGERAPESQHAVLVLPSSGEFDSRTYRIATTLLARGHRVTVLARLQPGLAEVEDHPAGYRIIRLQIRALDGLPGRSLVAATRRHLAVGGGSADDAARPRPGTPAVPGAPVPPVTATSRAGSSLVRVPVTLFGGFGARRWLMALARRFVRALVRRFAVPFTIRAHIRAAVAIAPAADLYHGMAYMGIPVALALGRRHRAPVVYDARDIYLEARRLSRTRGLERWAFARAERGWAGRASQVITVNDDYADQLEDRLRIRRPLVVMNCSYRFDPPEPRERRFHELLGLERTVPLVLYHGGFFPERGIEQLMAAIVDVPGAVLVLMGYGLLWPQVREWAAEPRFGGRVRLVPAVPPHELHDWLACADIAAMPIQPTTLNHRLSTPNKLFEAMAAGVPVVASDLPGMARIVSATGCGILCEGTDPSSIGAALRALVDDPAARIAMGERGLAAAHGQYNWERQADILLAAYGRLTGRPW